MTFTDAGRALLKRLEGLRMDAYQDQGKRGGVWTIGYGHTGDVRPGQQINEHQAEVILEHDLQRFCAAVSHFVGSLPLSDEQYSALVIFAFNEGVTAFAGSTALRDIEAGRLDLVPGELRRWKYIHDKSGVALVSPILVRRREAEIALWNSGSQQPAA